MALMALDNNTLFLRKGGEMGTLTRAKDWSKTPLGAIETWPQSLRTTLSIVLNSRFPMFLWWGPELICFYNDAYRPSLGENGKHPGILGMKAEAAWTEIWDIIKPLIDQVLAGGSATWSEDQLIPIYRNGKIEDVYWTFSYSPVNDESDKVAGVLVTCSETTEKVNILKTLEESKDQLQFAIEAAEFGTWDFNPATNKFISNSRLKEWFGLPAGKELDLTLAINAIAERDRDKVIRAIEKALDFSSGGHYDIEYSIVHPITNKERIVQAKGRAWFNSDHLAYRFNGTLQDVTAQATLRQKLEESEKRFRNVADSVPVLIWGAGPDKLCNFFNIAWLDFTGRSMEEEMGDGWVSGVHIDDLQRFTEVYSSAFEKQSAFNIEYRLKRHDGEYRWISDNGVPRFTIDGVFEGYIGACMDIHERIIYEQKLKNDEERLSIVINASDLGTWELNLKTKQLNYSNRYSEIVGYHNNNCLTHEQVLEQLHPDDLVIRENAFAEAYKTGILHFQCRIIWNDQSIHWIENRGKVFFDEEHQPANLIGTARDITDEKNYQQVLQEREQKFRLLADSMPQLVWTGDAEGNLNYFNQSVYNYSGLTPEQINAEGWLQIVHPDEQEENVAKWMHSINTGSDFLFEHRFRRSDGEFRWQLSRAIPQKDAAGNISMWVGTSTDIEEQKMFTKELEKQVRERTSELEQKNRELQKMNTELQSFAYVSSHDLQEPLRKIQTFALRILDKEGDRLSENGKDYFGRMQNAAKRMQVLIDDLLTYSRTNITERNFEKTDLTEILNEVKIELKEELQQTHASITSEGLCEANIIPFQFRQLLNNLIGNSLKFSRPDEQPQIKLACEMINGSKVPGDALSPHKLYCHLRISDNGIGFEPQYHERIFEVFQRLHGKKEYKGTGIGLAIVKKIVENHNGFITATGELNKGASFDIYFPAS